MDAKAHCFLTTTDAFVKNEPIGLITAA